MTKRSPSTSLAEPVQRAIDTEVLLTNLERELRRSQPRWGYIEIWLRKHGWSPEDNYAVLLPESFPLGSDRGKPYWVVLWCPVEHLRVERSIFPYPLMPESWSKPHWPAI